MPVIPATGKQSREDLEFKDNLNYMRSSLQNIYLIPHPKALGL